MIDILLVDDHKMIREGLKSFLIDHQEIRVVAEAENGKEALNYIEQHVGEIDVLVTDIAMPVMDGITLVKEVRKLVPDQKIVALTMMNESQYIKQMLSSGASGYVLKNCTDDEFVGAITSVYKGGTYYSQEVTEVIMENLAHARKPKQRLVFEVPLTAREKQVLHLICKELGNQEIADKLFISVRTVEAHKRNLLEKTGCKNVAGLVVYAIEKSLFEDV